MAGAATSAKARRLRAGDEREPVALLCTEEDLTRERRGLADALGRITDVAWLTSPAESLDDAEEDFRRRGFEPGLLVAPDVHGRCLPRGVERARCPTAILHIDSFSGTRKRAEISRLFDVAVVFHPSSVAALRRLGIEHVAFMPHAFDPTRVRLRRATEARSVDIAFVGRTSPSLYDERLAVLRMLRASEHRVSIEDGLSYEGMLALYGEAKIGVNLPRDDYPGDANLRCFEVMGAGAMLVTRSPSELEEMGFEEGEDFVGYATRTDLAETLRRLLSPDRERERAAIAGRGQAKVLAEHTYDATARRLLAAVDDPVRAHARRRLVSPIRFSEDVYARHCLACGATSQAIGALSAGPARDWASAPRAKTLARLARAVCGRWVTGQPIR